MDKVLKEQAEALQLDEVEGGWEPQEGVELAVVVKGGGSAISLDAVTRIVTTSDAWIVFRDGDNEVAWVRPESIVMIRSRGSEKKSGRSRTGFS